MSILIKGMDTPKDCASCDLSYYCDGYNGGYGYSPSGWRCRRLNHIIKEAEETRPSDCPLTEIPSPHGDLIDADKLLKTIEANDYMLCSALNTFDRGMFTIGIQQAIDEAPTIIEAEGKA